MSKNDPVEFTAELKHETDMAYLVNDGDDDIWIPKSQTEMEHISGVHYEFTVPEWLAEVKGIV